MPATGTSSDRWAEGRAYMKLCVVSMREHDYTRAVTWLDEAHNLGRDNIVLHAATHFRYTQLSLREGCYRRALGHIFWALSSPVFVPISRAKRTALIGEWKPAPPLLGSAQAPIVLSLDAVVDAVVTAADAGVAPGTGTPSPPLAS